MPTERKRFVYKEWVRDPKGKLLVKPPPKGKRTPNNIIWGHTLDDFFWIPRIPTVNVLTIWSRSMIQEYGENYLNESHDDEPEPRRLRPWPVLMLPAHIRTPISSELGIIDRDCADRHDPVPRRVEEVVGGKPNVATGTKAKPKVGYVEGGSANTVPLKSYPATRSLCVIPAPQTVQDAAPISNTNADSTGSSVHFPGTSSLVQYTAPVATGDVAVVPEETAPMEVDTSAAALPFSVSVSCTPVPAPDASSPAAACSPRWSSDNKEWADAKNALPADKADPEPLATEKEGVAATETEGVSATKIERLVATETAVDTPAPDAAQAQSSSDVALMDVDAPKNGDGAVADKPARADERSDGMDLDLEDKENLAIMPPDNQPRAAVALGSPADSTLVGAESTTSNAEATKSADPPSAVAAASPAIPPASATLPTSDATPIAAPKPVSTPTRAVETTPPPPPSPAPPTFHDLPKLEEFIPDEYFPDILFVNDPDDNTTITASYNYKYRDSKPQSEAPLLRQYKRVWPRFARDGEPATAFSTDPDSPSIKLPKASAPRVDSAAAPAPSISASHSSPPTVPSPGTNLHVARLDLSSAPRLGIGNHSVVHRAALRLPHPLAGRSPSGEVTVAAKTSFSNSEARALLLNEGRIYDAFPKHLQEDWCGLNLVAPITHPVPVHAVVPKFYGYYAPVREDVERDRQAAVRVYKERKRKERYDARREKREAKAAAKVAKEAERRKQAEDKVKEGGSPGEGDDMAATKIEDIEESDSEEEQDDMDVIESEAEAKDEANANRQFKYSTSYQSWSRMSPILLLEECGSPIVPSKFSDDDRSECYSLALRLHFSEFTQGSFYVRNILRQPGPLTVAPSERSNRTPSFRIIDFGRGEHWPYQLAAAEKENEERRAHQAGERDVMDVPTEAEMKQRIEEEEEEDAEDKKVLERCGKSWWESRDYEVRKAHSELIVKDFDY